MASLVTLRALNRGSRIRVKDAAGDLVTLQADTGVTVDLDDPEVRTQLSHHTAIGQFIVEGGTPPGFMTSVGTGAVTLIGPSPGRVGLSDDGALTGNGIYWVADGTDGEQTVVVQIGVNVWRVTSDGGLQLPNGNTLYNTAGAPGAGVGVDSDWALAANGHVYFKTAGAWGVII